MSNKQLDDDVLLIHNELIDRMGECKGHAYSVLLVHCQRPYKSYSPTEIVRKIKISWKTASNALKLLKEKNFLTSDGILIEKYRAPDHLF